MTTLLRTIRTNHSVFIVRRFSISTSQGAKGGGARRELTTSSVPYTMNASVGNDEGLLASAKNFIPPLSNALHKGQAGRIAVIGGRFVLFLLFRFDIFMISIIYRIELSCGESKTCTKYFNF